MPDLGMPHFHPHTLIYGTIHKNALMCDILPLASLTPHLLNILSHLKMVLEASSFKFVTVDSTHLVQNDNFQEMLVQGIKLSMSTPLDQGHVASSFHD